MKTIFKIEKVKLGRVREEVKEVEGKDAMPPKKLII